MGYRGTENSQKNREPVFLCSSGFSLSLCTPPSFPNLGRGKGDQSIRTFTTTLRTVWRAPAMQPGLCASSG
jgi:hypothetical protein